MWRALTVLGCLLAGTVAHAADPASLRADAQRLTNEIGAIRLAQAQEPNLRVAAVEVRLSRLEEELRRLTGRIEEVEYRQSQLQTRMERLVSDIDARLQAVDGSRGAAAAPAPAAQPPEPAPQPQQQAALPSPTTQPQPVRPSQPAQPAQPAARSTIEPDAAARQGYVLGTLPEEALRGGRAPTLPAPGEAPAQQEARLTPQGADADYQRGLDLLQAGRWPEAEAAFTGFVQAYPDDPRAPAASYWLAETYFFRKDYPTAAAVFARNYRTYGEKAQRAPENLLKLGMSLAAMGDRERACQTFGELARRHPTAPAPVRQQLSRERAAAGCS